MRKFYNELTKLIEIDRDLNSSQNIIEVKNFEFNKESRDILKHLSEKYNCSEDAIINAALIEYMNKNKRLKGI